MAISRRRPNLLVREPGTSASARFLVTHVTFPAVRAMYDKMESTMWTANELDFEGDAQGFDALTPSERHMLLTPLKFFATADGAVNLNLGTNFAGEIPYGEVGQVYAIQAYIENVHQTVYGQLLDTYVRDPVELDRLLNAADNTPCVKHKMEWALRHMNTEMSFAKRLFGFAIMEGFFFQSSFFIIFWFARQKVRLPCLVQSNELISRDEGLHFQFAVLLYDLLHEDQRISEAEMYEMMDEALRVEEEFVNEAIPVPLPGINAKGMMMMVRHWANEVLRCFGCKRRYKTRGIVYEWARQVGQIYKSNFFERRVGNYGQVSRRALKLDPKTKRLRRSGDVHDSDFEG